MGENYYWRMLPQTCDKCGHLRTHELHIGKSSMGWAFTLRVYPELGIHDLPDWIELWKNTSDLIIKDDDDKVTNPGDYMIFNEQDFVLGWKEMLKVIENRKGSVDGLSADRLRLNFAVWDKENCLMRSTGLAGYLGQGKGTWDRVSTDFS